LIVADELFSIIGAWGLYLILDLAGIGNLNIETFIDSHVDGSWPKVICSDCIDCYNQKENGYAI